MNIFGTKGYQTNPREKISFAFRRSRTNLPVSPSIDDGEFRPVLNQFALNMPSGKGIQRQVVIIVVGEDNDSCNLTITGESGPADQDALVVMDMPVASARYRFTVV